MVIMGIRFVIWNWWIGSTVIIPSPRAQEAYTSRLFITLVARNDTRGAHHVEHAGGEAEQQKYNEPPRREPEPAVDQPAEAGADQHACNKFVRKPEAPRVTGCSRLPIHLSTVG